MRKIFFLFTFICANSIFSQTQSNENNLSVLKSQEQIITTNKPEVLNSENKRFNHLINLLSVSLIAILSLLCLALYKNNIIKYKSNKLLQEKNKELELEKLKVEQANNSKDEFLATISHELKTPLNSINILSEILFDDKPKKSQIENIISLKISANYLLNLINDVLQINQIESTTFKIEETEFNIFEKINNIEKTLFEIAKQNNVICIFNIDKKIPENLIGDHVKISQILINLITNAIKFSKDGIVTTNISKVENNQNEIKIKFEVIDNGIGIPKNQQEMIFEIFKQASPEISKKFGGTGLGLSIVKKLVEHLGGKINLNSEVGNGSNFNFELNFKSTLTNLIESDEPDFTIFNNKNFLIVEDNSITQVITQKLLTRHDALCDVASTGKEALAMIKDRNYEMIIMDINLPDLNGDLVTEEIRKFNTIVPIIGFTAIHKETCIEYLKEKGFNDFITKPVNTKLFYEKIISNLN